jgi:hypothetical protein
VSETLRKEIDCKLKDNLEMRVACWLLYDLAARCQDLLKFKYNSFKVDESGAIVEWVPKKTVKKNISRLGLITKETYLLIQDL